MNLRLTAKNYKTLSRGLKKGLSHARIKKPNKYNAKRVVIDGINFDSKAEGNYYEYLKKLKQDGEILYFHRQVPFQLPGGVKYFVDFMAVYLDKDIKYYDVKGLETDMFKLKKKQVEDLYPVKIEIVKNGRIVQ